ncbi:CBS domain-containing protein [Herbiconiux sp. SYSU D00978]|uniref:CBS domain-containing protein n=1 Tax=Herbiconiux sp. SYSU D00978 TaxID=2812562 RepID=UPI001A96AF36|nr:CBS domain-containing protein [Herbiconiux sp. SYSU D00978]
MTTARDIMMPGAEYVTEDENLVTVAQKLRDLNIGALPVCGPDKHLKGIVTDRDIVVKTIATGDDPASVTAGSLTADQDEVVTVGADDDIQVALETMKKYQVRRLPVIDGTDLVGMISQADIATSLGDKETADVVEEISE